MTARQFGTMPTGDHIVEAVIAAGDLSVSVISYGAVIRDIRLAGIDRPLVLGFTRLEDYIAYSPHFGAVAGRCANRIASGRFTLDGTTYQLSLNENGRNHLHGGFNGFGHRAWRLAGHDRDSVTLAISAADGEEGYPGNVEVLCRYSVEPPATLRVDFEATTDAPTLVNLAQHSYFNLGGEPDILSHCVRIAADAYTPVDDASIPTGAIATVAGTRYDFRQMRPVRRDGDRSVDYDINFAVADARSPTPRPVARLESPDGRVALDVATTQPGLQFYDGCNMTAIPVAGLDGRRYGLHGGCCFEGQVFPDSPNHPGFPSAILRPGETYRQTTVYGFRRGSLPLFASIGQDEGNRAKCLASCCFQSNGLL